MSAIEERVHAALEQADRTGEPAEVLDDDGKRVMLIVKPRDRRPMPGELEEQLAARDAELATAWDVIEGLREALSFYAEPANWCDGFEINDSNPGPPNGCSHNHVGRGDAPFMPDIYQEDGKRAREALAASREPEPAAQGKTSETSGGPRDDGPEQPLTSSSTPAGGSEGAGASSDADDAERVAREWYEREENHNGSIAASIASLAALIRSERAAAAEAAVIEFEEAHASVCAAEAKLATAVQTLKLYAGASTPSTYGPARDTLRALGVEPSKEQGK